VYQGARYFWRPGFWHAYQPNWVWLPAHYVWTPSGCLFVEGYWDRALDRRGLLFAPARINRPAFLAARQPFVPGFAVNTDFLLGALFVRPANRHYYFGDYFAPEYAKRGFVAWPDYSPVKGAFDPTFAYYRRQHAADPKWEPALRTLYTGRRGGEIPRPPVTLAKQLEVIKAIGANKTANIAVHKDINFTHIQNVTAVAPIKEVHNLRATNLGPLGGNKEAVAAPALKLQAVQKDEREREQKAAAVMRQSAQIRRDAEAHILTQGKVPVQHTDPAHITKWELPKLPAHVGAPPVAPKALPPVVVLPKHEEQPIPKYTPPPPFVAPKKGGKP
jgi:hypothetical protein